MRTHEPIDLVYRWICPKRGITQLDQILRDGASPMLAQMSVINRYRDNSELKYSLRSVAKYAPWVKAIYIVGEGEPPKWLCLEHPINWVDTLELQISFGQTPQPNSETQKLYFSGIPGLSERFICFDDDWMFGNIVNEDDFFADAGTPIQPTLGTGFGEHGPIAWTRALYDYALRKLPPAYRESIRNAGSTRPDPWMPMRELLAEEGLVIVSAERDAQIWLRDTTVHQYEKVLAEIRQTKPKSFCINDDWSLDPHEYAQEMLHLTAFLSGMYPLVPSWEVDHP